MAETACTDMAGTDIAGTDIAGTGMHIRVRPCIYGTAMHIRVQPCVYRLSHAYTGSAMRIQAQSYVSWTSLRKAPLASPGA